MGHLQPDSGSGRAGPQGRERDAGSILHGSQLAGPRRTRQGKTIKNKEGKTIYEEQKREKPICKQYTVFNVEQAEGLKLKPREDQVRPEWDAHRDAEKVIAANGATVAARRRRSRRTIAMTRTR